MFRKQIGHFVMVSLKYFFDLDPSFSSHCLLLILVTIGVIKLSIVRLSGNIHVGLLQVKNNMLEWRAGIITLIERRENGINSDWRLK